jgi:hypothetical protein
MRKLGTASTAGLAVLFLLLTVFGGHASAQSITQKFRIINHVTKIEMAPTGVEKGHTVGIVMRGGLAIFENGEVANQTAVLIFDAILGKGGTYDAYTTVSFEDGSSWVAKTKASMERTPDQKRLLTKNAGELVNGSGKYEGIKGTIYYSGIAYGPNEVGKGDWVGDGEISYTLPQK